MVGKIIDQMEIDNLLDYGCGSNLSLTKSLKPERQFKYQAYDPMVDKYAADPVPSQMVTSIDMIEHVEPEYLEDVLDHIEELTEQVLFMSIHTMSAKKVLDDGRNAHLTQQPMEWWLPKLFERFTIHSVQVTSKGGFYVVAFNKDLDNN